MMTVLGFQGEDMGKSVEKNKFTWVEWVGLLVTVAVPAILSATGALNEMGLSELIAKAQMTSLLTIGFASAAAYLTIIKHATDIKTRWSDTKLQLLWWISALWAGMWSFFTGMPRNIFLLFCILVVIGFAVRPKFWE